MRSLEEIDRDLEIAYADMRNFIHSGMHISPVLEDDIDELRDERAAVVKAMQDAGLMRYEVCILPKPETRPAIAPHSTKLRPQAEIRLSSMARKPLSAALQTAASLPKILTQDMTSASRKEKRSNESTRFKRLQALPVLRRTRHGQADAERP